MSHPFTSEDLLQLKERSLAPEDLLRQIALFKSPPPAVCLERPAVAGDGIHVLSEAEADRFVQLHGPAAAGDRLLKFIPASGAATRMFDDILKGEEVAVRRIAEERRNFAFYEEWAAHFHFRGESLEELLEKGGGSRAVEVLVSHDGIDLPRRPKGLLPFHRYKDGSRTPLEEHLVEASHTLRDREGKCRVHLTVSPEHRGEFLDALPRMKKGLEASLESTFKISCSVQEASSETLAVGPDDEPFRDQEGRLVFRPGGHGALLRNLQRTGGDLVYVKNIDNVVPDRLKGPTLHWKKVLAGLLVSLQERVHSFLVELEKGKPAPGAVSEMREFCRRWFFRDPWAGGLEGPALVEWFHRPLRVCGMVRNTGEPGGGPYWVKGRKGGVTLQVVERAQADLADPGQKAVFEGATHFNPVDLVCGLRDHREEPYDLGRYADHGAVFISRKTLDGQSLKALEWPGLWNGAMYGWITVLVEVPLETFDPVKTVFDLLRPRHRQE